jgi:hypothetical protein
MVKTEASKKPRTQVKKSLGIAQKPRARKCSRPYTIHIEASVKSHIEIPSSVKDNKDLEEVIQVSFIRNRAVMADLAKY